MSATSVDRDSKRSEGRVKAYRVASATTIKRGTLVGLNSSGFLVDLSDTASLQFAGVAMEGKVNPSGGTEVCRVYQDGEHEFLYAGGDATQAKVGAVAYAQDNQTVDEDVSLTTNDYPVGIITEVVSGSIVRVNISYALGAANVVTTGLINAGAVTNAKTSANARVRTTVIPVENLAAGADIAARAEFIAPATGGTLRKIGFVAQANPAGIDDANTAVIAWTDAAGNSIVSKTYNTGTQPGDADIYNDLGTLDVTHKVLTANEVVKMAITQGTTADLGALRFLIEWEPSD